MAEPILGRGSQGQDVSDLQQALIELGLRPGEVDGVFGVYTESAVRSFQHLAQVLAVGVVDAATWERLDDADRTDPTVREGSASVAVRGLQRRLLDAGLDAGEIDGRFGPRTDAAVRAFQERAELEADGIVGPSTWEQLRAVALHH